MSRTSDEVNTSVLSYYIDRDFYENLQVELKKFDDDFSSTTLEQKAIAEQVLFQEARFIDELRLEEWLDMFTKECLYWIPTIPGGGNPKKEVSIAFDDRRRLEDRVYRLRTGYAYSQLPLSRTRRMITNIEVAQGSCQDELYVRANFILSEFRAGKLESFSGWIAYRLERDKLDWKIGLKMVNLIDSDQHHDNLTFIL